jgi:hypothetical protein
MNYQRLEITNVGQQASEFQAVDQETACSGASLDTKRKDSAKRVGTEKFLRKLVWRVWFQPRIEDPRNLGMLFEMFGQSESIVAVPLNT